jgi:hypothetical protein
MKRTLFLSLVALLAAALIATASMPKSSVPKSADELAGGLKVHEWGTFTSVAGEHGAPVSWRTFGGPDDLPCFVDRFSGFKGMLLLTVRMETPVLYFYGSQPLNMSVKVDFPKGYITEWYPKAALGNRWETIEWRDVKLQPGAASQFPVEPGSSHYYAARDTDAVPLQVADQTEKFLFYRGVGTFPLPLSGEVLKDGKVLVAPNGNDHVTGLIQFENRGGKIGYRVIGKLDREVTLDPRSLGGDLSGLFVELENILVTEGLYRKEAHAMVETWRDSWFEGGSRLFYIVPQRIIDSVLPLRLEPKPVEIERVFVGRMELITPAIQEDVKRAIASTDVKTLQTYGRFLEPIAKRIGVKTPMLADPIAPSCRRLQ